MSKLYLFVTKQSPYSTKCMTSLEWNSEFNKLLQEYMNE